MRWKNAWISRAQKLIDDTIKSSLDGIKWPKRVEFGSVDDAIDFLNWLQKWGWMSKDEYAKKFKDLNPKKWDVDKDKS